MGYEVVVSPLAAATLHRLQPKRRNQLLSKVWRVAEAPYARHNNVTRLQGREGYRLRVGDWRIIYTLEDEALILLVMEIGPRGGIYQ